MIFAGLMSLCVIPLSWRYPTAEQSCRKYVIALSGDRQTGIRWDKYGITTLLISFVCLKIKRKTYIAKESVMMNASNVMILG